MTIANAYNFILIALSVHSLVKVYFSSVYYNIFMGIGRTFSGRRMLQTTVCVWPIHDDIDLRPHWYA